MQFKICDGAVSFGNTMLVLQITRGIIMKTVEEVISYLKLELDDAYKLHDEAKGKDSANALTQLIRATTIQILLDNITAE